MNHANIQTSERLQRVDKFLSDGLFHSTRDIVIGAQVMAVSAVVSELRENGRNIICRQKGRIFYYRMVQEQERAA
ncbi:MAG: hypothetical protein H7A05_10980 [Pseudomonadales bacterium]|nr:hypothetical protein [Pseudomonadales bacterium]